MKKIILSSVILCLGVFSSCEKENDTELLQNNSLTNSAVESSVSNIKVKELNNKSSTHIVNMVTGMVSAATTSSPPIWTTVGNADTYWDVKLPGASNWIDCLLSSSFVDLAAGGTQSLDNYGSNLTVISPFLNTNNNITDNRPAGIYKFARLFNIPCGPITAADIQLYTYGLDEVQSIKINGVNVPLYSGGWGSGSPTPIVYPHLYSSRSTYYWCGSTVGSILNQGTTNNIIVTVNNPNPGPIAFSFSGSISVYQDACTSTGPGTGGPGGPN